ncbi:hypothetical protein [Halosegnis marinus]|uniref:hypothetical protein n=1 Tax=Halosegnis marinus TaxID=3034023 RepID=UPI00360E5A47
MTGDDVRSAFGADVAETVEAVSFDEGIDDYLERHYDIYRRCFETGRGAVLVKAADVLDNSEYYGLGDSAELGRNQVEKMTYFVENSEPYIGDEDIHRELAEALPTVRERVAERNGN